MRQTFYRERNGSYYRADTDQARQTARWLGLVVCDPPASATWVVVSACGGLYRAENAK